MTHTPNNNPPYFAFISYKSEDEKWAKWLQKKLEGYGFPIALRKEKPSLPAKIKPIFRDKSDLSGGNLKNEIEKGLRESKYLIVICSPKSAKSPWVSKEVEYFIDNNRQQHIIPFIIKGIPNSKNPKDECFPVGLRRLSGEHEILGININDMGREAAAVKVIARMFDVRFDTLWQRHERARRRRNLIYATLAVIGIILAIIMGYLYNKAEKQTQLAILHNQRAERQKDNVIAQFANQLLSSNSHVASLLALDLLRKDINNVEAETVLRKSSIIENLILHGHEKAVNSVSFDPYNSSKLISASNDSTIKIWDLTQSKCIKTFRFDSPILSVCYIPNSHNVLCVSEKGNCYTYNTSIGKFHLRKRFQHELNKTFCSHDGSKLVTIDNQHNLKVFDTKTLEIIYYDQLQDEGEITMSFSSNSESLVYYNSGINELVRINLHTGKKQIKKYSAYVSNFYSSALGINPSGSQIAIGFANEIEFLDSTLNSIKKIPSESLNHIEFDTINNQPVIFTASEQGFIKIWDASNLHPLFTFNSSCPNIRSLLLTPTKRHLVFWGINGDLRILDSASISSNPTYPTVSQYNSPDFIASFDITNSDNQIYLATANDQILRILHYEYNDNSYQVVGSHPLSDLKYTDIKFTPSGRYLISATNSTNNKLYIWDTHSGRLLTSFIPHNGEFFNYTINSNKDCVITLSGKSIKMWDIDNICKNQQSQPIPMASFSVSDEVLHKLAQGVNSQVKCIDKDYNLYYESKDKENTIKVYNLRKHSTNNDVSYQSDSKYIKEFQLSPLGNYLSILGSDGKIIIYDIKTHTMFSKWYPHWNYMSTEHVWHPSEKYIISSSRDNNTCIWDVKSGKCVLSVSGQFKNLNFSVCGNYFWGNSYQSIQIFQFPSIGVLMNHITQKFKNRKLTDKEKHIYHLE